MGDLEEELRALLSPEDAEAEYPTKASQLRRPEPVRLPLAQAAADCAIGQILAAEDDGSEIAVAKLASGALVVLTDLCPHDGGLLSDGFVDGEAVVCARHGWEFEGRTGKCLSRDGVSVPCHALKSPHI
jgi:nitrite reductase/ring-hydroxylating ferredoxin subunit